MTGKVWGSAVTAAESASRARRAQMRAYNRRIRRQALAAYGARCDCCEEREESFLTVDHVNGAAHRRYARAPRAGTALYHWLRRHAFPQGFRVLCWNCNNAIGHYGRCPHRDRPRGQNTSAAARPRR